MFAGIESEGESRERDAGEGYEILDYCFAANLIIKFREMTLKVYIKEVVRLVRFKNRETRRVFGGYEEGNGASYVRFKLKVVAKTRVFKHSFLELVAGHRSEGTEATIDSYIIRCYDLVVPFVIAEIVKLGL